MKKKAALAVCSILAASFAASALSNSFVEAKTGRAALNLTPELAAKMNETASTESTEGAADEGTSEEAEEASTEESGLRRAEDAAAEEDTAGEEDDDTIRESTDYFTLRLPAEWKDHYVTEESAAAEGIPSIAFYEKTAHDNQEGGLLFSIGLYTDRKNYLALPDYVYLGELTADDGTVYAAVAEFPSDVQFAIEAREQYETMAAEIPSVLSSLRAVDGMTYHAGQSREEQNAEQSYAFASILDQFRSSGALPNGTMIDLADASSSMNQYAILDVDGDGTDELVLRIASKALSSKISPAQETDSTADENAAASNEGAEDAGETASAAEDASADNTASAQGGEAAAEEPSSAAITSDAEGNTFGFTTGSAGTSAAEESEDGASGNDEENTLASGAEQARVNAEPSGEEERESTAGEDSDGLSGSAGTDENAEPADADAASAAESGQNADAVDDYDYYDVYAHSNYYVFKGDSADDSHAAHLTMDGLEEALKNTSEDYISTAYDIGWLNISRGNVNGLYHTAYTAVGVSPAHEDAARRHAYKEALTNIVENNELPDASQAISYVDYTAEDMEENSFAVADVDADGVSELLVQLNNTAADSQRELVYGYDAEKDELVLEFTGVPGNVTYYENGSLMSEAQYNGNVPSTMWPFALYSYDEESGTYKSQGSVYAWDQDVMSRQTGRTVDALGEGFDKAADKDGNGRIYFLQKADGTEADSGESDDTAASPATSADLTPVDDADVSEWFTSVVGANSSKADLYWVSLTEDNIGSMLAK